MKFKSADARDAHHEQVTRLLKTIVEQYCRDEAEEAVECNDVHEAIRLSGADVPIRDDWTVDNPPGLCDPSHESMLPEMFNRRT